MSAQPSPSPPNGPAIQLDESNLPQGQCRYILLLPEIKGHRCACVTFTLNRAMPSATCDCGHLACFHVKSAESTTDKHELDTLKRRVELLEEQLDRERQGGLGSIVARVSELEELVDKSREDATQEIKDSYRNISRVWQSVEQLQQQTSSIRNEMSTMQAEMKSLRDRHLELLEGDLNLEERIDQLEGSAARPFPQGRPRRKSTSDSLPPLNLGTLTPRRLSIDDPAATREVQVFPAASTFMTYRGRPGARTPLTSWTVHISLLPSASLPFPFERDTNAYQRCLSRGLHQIVVIEGMDSESFVSAVSKAFESVLKGRQWMPLQAKLCNAEQLQGLPMLRKLDPELVDCRYDVEFLRKHCAVCDASGKIESLYVAMRSDKLSWHFLRHSPIIKQGLEASWAYDERLDLNAGLDDESINDDDQPSAGDIIPNLPSLKRAASEISRTSSFGSSTGSSEGEVSRAKIPRTCMAGLVEAPRRVEKV